MRMIGTLAEERQARQFGDYLLVRGIANQVDPGKAGDWELWVEDDDEIPAAQEALARFNADPEAEEFKAAREAGRRRAEMEREQREARKRVIDMRTQMQDSASAFNFPVTIALMLVCIGVTFASNFGQKLNVVLPLSISPYVNYGPYQNLQILIALMAHGQVWRPITPIFLHFNIMHIAFNMWWMWDLGRMIEPRKGSIYFSLLVLTLAIPSNILQYLVHGPEFGGISGVVFGLIGYMWTRNHFSYRMVYPLNPQIMSFIAIFFVICVLGLMGPIANWAHGGGLAVGALWGWLASDKFRRMLRG